jgi:hypothetical protein
MKTIITQKIYGRRFGRNNQLVGEMVAFKGDDNNINIGWSICHPNDYKKITNKKSFDEFRNLTRNIAIDRAINNFNKNIEIPRQYRTEIVNFVIRARKYFKDSNMFPRWSRSIYFNF